MALSEKLLVRKSNYDFKNELHDFALTTEGRFDETMGELQFLSDIYKARAHVVKLGERVTLTGFVEQRQIKNFEQHFKGMANVEIQIQDAEADKRFSPPTKLTNNWFTRPFQFFVEMYGGSFLSRR